MKHQLSSLRIHLVGLALLTLVARPALAADVDGAKIHWTSTGSGPAVIFVHGWTCDESSWQGQVPAFSKQYRVITLDLPGHGKSDLPKNGTFSRINVSSVSRLAIISGSVAFLAPEIGIVPFRRCPPTIRIRSMLAPPTYSRLFSVSP